MSRKTIDYVLEDQTFFSFLFGKLRENKNALRADIFSPQSSSVFGSEAK